MKNILLEVTRVTKDYKMGGVTFRALDGVSLIVKQGEFVAIMGPSGSGKSTLMHIMGCLDKPTTGSVKLKGTEIFKATETKLAYFRNKSIGFVFQQFNLLRRTTALANVELPLVYGSIASQERKRQAKKQLEAVGLSDKFKNFPSQLSGGQQQRVAIARALVTDPDIILADEPTGNLDSKSGIEIMNILKKLNRQGKTVIVVTHERNIAVYARRIVKIADGKIIN